MASAGCCDSAGFANSGSILRAGCVVALIPRNRGLSFFNRKMKFLQRLSKQTLFLKCEEVAGWSASLPSMRWRSLTLGWADISDFPFESVNFAHLRTLELLNVDMAEFPAEIFQIKELRRLAVRGAKLTQIPDGVAQLRELRYLDFGSNQLKNFDIDLRACHHLQWFQISDNPLQKLPSLLSPNTFLGLAGTLFREFNGCRFRDLPK